MLRRESFPAELRRVSSVKYVYRSALLRDLTEQGFFILSERRFYILPDLNAWKSRPIKGMALAMKEAIVFLKAGKSGRKQKPSMEAKRLISYPGSRMTRRR